MNIWLLKTEPSVYSYDDLERDGETMWDGVNNNTALQNIRKITRRLDHCELAAVKGDVTLNQRQDAPTNGPKADHH